MQRLRQGWGGEREDPRGQWQHVVRWDMAKASFVFHVFFSLGLVTWPRLAQHLCMYVSPVSCANLDLVEAFLPQILRLILFSLITQPNNDIV